MKQRLKTIIMIFVIIIITIWIIDKIPFKKTINQHITANIYEKGIIVGQTMISIDGEKSNYLFRKRKGFVGEFLIPCVEKTDRKDLQTYIIWNSKNNTQRISYFYKGSMKLPEDMGLAPYLLISDNMNRFAIMLTDHRVIATSNELYELYMKHFTWDDDIKVTTISEINKIPRIK